MAANETTSEVTISVNEALNKLVVPRSKEGAPSILYLADGIPNDASYSKPNYYKVISHFQKKRNNGGEVIEEEYKCIGPNAALILFENAFAVSQIETIDHIIDDQPVKLYPLVTEKVTIEIEAGSSFVQALMLSKDTVQLIEKEELLVTGAGSRYVIEGNWLSVENFRKHFKQLLTKELCHHAKDNSFSELLSLDDAVVLSQHSPTDELASSPPKAASTPPEPASTVTEGSDKSISAASSNLNPDVLALMEKIGAYRHSAVSYDQQTMTINIDCDDVTEKEKIKEELFTAYRELMMGGKLKEHSVSVSDVQQASAIVDEYNKTFNHTYFKYDAEKGEIKCLSTDARQMQHVRKRLNVSFQRSNSAQSSAFVQSLTPTKSVFIDLPKISRRVTIKLSNIVDEDVDAIVNAANDRLQHVGGVAAAIDRASDGEVQKASNQLISQRGSVATGDAVATTVAGGRLKCKMVIHAVGPKAYQHKQNCGPLLKSACNNAMIIAEQFECKSISFPPISSGIYAVSKELVANVMLSTLCSYKCHSPALLTDVRIVIIDDPTYQVFLNVFHKEEQRLESLLDDPVLVPHVTTSTSGILQPAKFQYSQYSSPPGFPVRVPSPGLGAVWPSTTVPLYSQAVTHQPIGGVGSQRLSPGDAAVQGTGSAGLLPPTSTSSPANPILSTAQNYNQTQSHMLMTKPQHIISTSFETPVSTPLPITVTSNSTPPDGSTVPISTPTMNSRGSKGTDGVNGSDVLIDSFKEGENNDAENKMKHRDNNGINNDKKNIIKVTKASESTENGFVKVGKSLASSANSPSVSTTTATAAAAADMTQRLYPNLEMASDDPLSQHQQHNNDPSQGTNSQEKRLCDGPKEQANFSKTVTLPNKSLPPTTKVEKKETESCPICFEEAANKPPTAVKCCKHCKQVYCKSCLDEALKYKPYCPACTLPLRKITGNQPKGGTMTTYTIGSRLPGYEKFGTISITYHIPNGKQGREHPNPGQNFHGTTRTAYLPDSPEGKKVARLLRKAFDAGLIFTIGTSHTSGASNVVVWNDIHHKTNMMGGPQSYGYPDPTYLKRVTEELAAKGIKE